MLCRQCMTAQKIPLKSRSPASTLHISVTGRGLSGEANTNSLILHRKSQKTQAELQKKSFFISVKWRFKGEKKQIENNNSNCSIPTYMAPMPHLLLQLRGHSPITTGITSGFTHHILSSSLRPWHFSGYSYTFFLMLLPYWTATSMPLFLFVNHQNVQLVHHHFFVSLYPGAHHHFSHSPPPFGGVSHIDRELSSPDLLQVVPLGSKKPFGVDFCGGDHFRCWCCKTVEQCTPELAKFSRKPSQGKLEFWLALLAVPPANHANIYLGLIGLIFSSTISINCHFRMTFQTEGMVAGRIRGVWILDSKLWNVHSTGLFLGNGNWGGSPTTHITHITNQKEGFTAL